MALIFLDDDVNVTGSLCCSAKPNTFVVACFSLIRLLSLHSNIPNKHNALNQCWCPRRRATLNQH